MLQFRVHIPVCSLMALVTAHLHIPVCLLMALVTAHLHIPVCSLMALVTAHLQMEAEFSKESDDPEVHCTSVHYCGNPNLSISSCYVNKSK